MLPEPSVSSRSSTDPEATALVRERPSAARPALGGRVLVRLALGAWAVLVHAVYYLGYLHVR
jgi:hypothetical protein